MADPTTKEEIDVARQQNAVAQAVLEGSSEVARIAVRTAEAIFMEALLKRENPDWAELQNEVMDAVGRLNVEWRIGDA